MAKEEYSDVTSCVIINIFESNCNLSTHFFLVSISDYSYIYFVIKLCNFAAGN